MCFVVRNTRESHTYTFRSETQFFDPDSGHVQHLLLSFVCDDDCENSHMMNEANKVHIALLSNINKNGKKNSFWIKIFDEIWYSNDPCLFVCLVIKKRNDKVINLPKIRSFVRSSSSMKDKCQGRETLANLSSPFVW